MIFLYPSCPDKSDEVFSDDTEEPTAVTTVTDKYILKWPVFRLFQITGHSTVQFVCKIKACATGDNRCAVIIQSCR